MTEQYYTMYIYKADKRKKSGERLVQTTVWSKNTEAEMQKEVERQQRREWPTSKGFRIEFLPTMITVKSLMTGKDVQIHRDTPWCCNPSSETYWSM